jgi:hypothetical protein
MNLPNATQAVVERGKITGYLLNAAHPDNGGKARFFLALGFSAEGWPSLADALRQMPTAFPIAKSVASPHGSKYILDGRIETPCGKRPLVRTVWIVDAGTQTPRLVTAYPCEE